ncbi:MAG: DNA-3-methyladenine glycosylase I [bacterium]|nr:DNA-3-methyladenine glycosylase I [bacterium]
MEKKRCGWCLDGGIMQEYHDKEWGIPVHDDKVHFEYLLMEVMQCGLNWTMMLKKREIFRFCFDELDFYKIATYDQEKIDQIMQTEGMIRSIRKISAIIQNAKLFIEIIEEYGSFDRFLWSHTNNKTIVYRSHDYNRVPDHNELSDLISKELKKRGFKYLGSITVYSHLQACGMINDHDRNCFLYHEIKEHYPVEIQD